MSEPVEHVDTNHAEAEAGNGSASAPAAMFQRPFTGYDREREAYARLKPRLLKEIEGKFVVFVGDEYGGPFETSRDAEYAGYVRFGLGPLYIKQVRMEEPVHEISRDVF